MESSFYFNGLRIGGLNIFQNIFDLVREEYQAQIVSQYRTENRYIAINHSMKEGFSLLIGV